MLQSGGKVTQTLSFPYSSTFDKLRKDWVNPFGEGRSDSGFEILVIWEEKQNRRERRDLFPWRVIRKFKNLSFLRK